MHAGITTTYEFQPIAKRHHPEACALITLDIPSLKATGEKQQCMLRTRAREVCLTNGTPKSHPATSEC